MMVKRLKIVELLALLLVGLFFVDLSLLVWPLSDSIISHAKLFSILFAIFLLTFWFAILYSPIVMIIIAIYSTRLRRVPKCSEMCSLRIEKNTAKSSGEEFAFTQSNLVYKVKSGTEPKCTILLMAHHDSKSQTFPTEARVLLGLSLSIVFITKPI